MSRRRRWRGLPHVVAIGGVALTLAACATRQPGTVRRSTASPPPTTTAPRTATTAPVTTTTASGARAGTGTGTTGPARTLPPLAVDTLPAPTDYACPSGLHFVAPANRAVGQCLPGAFAGGGADTACPAGSTMTMGPVECDTATGLVAFVPPGPDTCSTPGGPCPSSTLPLPAQAAVLPWAAITLPTGTCPAGRYFGETGGVATCVPYPYLPGGTAAEPNDDTACPAGAALRVAKRTGTLCTQQAEPYDVVAPVAAR